MITALQIRAMRAAMQEKLASRAVRRGDLEGMSKARWKQTAKDLPVVALGSGLGYATGRVLGDAVAERFLQGSPKEQKILSYAIPITSSMVSAMGAYTLGQQRALMRQRRDEAEALDKMNKSVKTAKKFVPTKLYPSSTPLADDPHQDAQGHHVEYYVRDPNSAEAKKMKAKLSPRDYDDYLFGSKDIDQETYEALYDKQVQYPPGYFNRRQAVPVPAFLGKVPVSNRKLDPKLEGRSGRVVMGAMLGGALGTGIGIARRDPELMGRLGLGGAVLGGLGGAFLPGKKKKAYSMTGSAFLAGPTKPNYPDFTRDHAKARRVNKRELPPVEDEEGFFWAGDDE